MNINLTIFVQALNFLVAYFIVRLLLIKPGMYALEQDKHELEELSAAVAGKNRALEAQEAERQRRWHMCQNSLVKLAPKSVAEIVTIQLIDTVKAPSISAEIVEQQAQEVARDITKRLSNVRI